MRIDLDYSVHQRPLVVTSARLAWLLLAAGSIALMVVVMSIRQEAANIDSLLHEQHLIARRMTSATQPTRVADREEVRQRDAAEAVRKLVAGKPQWLMHVLETERNDDVAVLTLAIDMIKGEAVLNGEARRFSAVTEFRERLSARPPMASANIVSHQAGDGPSPVPVRFEMRLTWGRE